MITHDTHTESLEGEEGKDANYQICTDQWDFLKSAFGSVVVRTTPFFPGTSSVQHNNYTLHSQELVCHVMLLVDNGITNNMHASREAIS